MNIKPYIWGLIALMIIPFLIDSVLADNCTTVIGDFVQDTNASNQSLHDFYDSGTGFLFSNEGIKTYGKGDFTSYTTCNGSLTRENADVPLNDNYTNIYCLYCHNLCLTQGANPVHNMSEEIIINPSKIRYYEQGLGDNSSEALKMAVDKNAITYSVKIDYIPMKTITKANVTGDDRYLDYEYRGKMMFFGQEYYVKDIDGLSTIYLDKGVVLENVTSDGFSGDYGGYKFKVNHLIYAAEYQVAGILIDVKKPDETVVQTQISKMANGVIDNLEIAGVSGEEAAALQNASLIVYNLTSQVNLVDGEDLIIGNRTYDNWEVSINNVPNCTGNCNHSEYENMTSSSDSLLKNITISYNHALDGVEALEGGESLLFPSEFELTFKSYLSSNYSEVSNSGEGEGNILVGRGEEPYQLVINLTGNNSVRYDGVRLDNGPFKRNDLFIAGGKLYKYDSYVVDKHGAGSADDTLDVNLMPEMGGSMLELTNMQKFCNDASNATDNLTATRAACGADIKFRELALINALKSNGEWDQDKNLTRDITKLWIKQGVADFGGRDVLCADEHIIIVPAGFVDDYNNGTQPLLKIDGGLVGNFSDFEVDGYSLVMLVNTTGGNSSNNYLGYKSTVVFETADGDVSINMYDRARVASENLDLNNSLVFKDVTISNDSDRMLIVADGGDKFTLNWGSNSRLVSVKLRHPIQRVHSTYFIGINEGVVGTCDLIGDYPPCDDVRLSEVVGFINQWIDGDVTLRQVVALINAWAAV